jgi:hypothetical protein
MARKSFIRMVSVPMGPVMVSRFLDRIDPAKRGTVLAILLASTWGALGIGIVLNGAAALIWFVAGVSAARYVGKPAPKVSTVRTDAADDSTDGAPADDSLEARQARVLARLKAESGEPPAEEPCGDDQRRDEPESDEAIAS